MLRISKLADYGIVVMAYFANSPEACHNAKAIAQKTRLQPPTVSKILKKLAKKGLVISQRGKSGGYRLAASAEQISLADIIQAMDGEIGLTACTHGVGLCQVEAGCTIQHNWMLISQSISAGLQAIRLAEIIKPLEPQKVAVLFNQLTIKVL